MDELQHLVLCGGLSDSPYIQYRVKEFVQDELKGSMKVIIPHEPTAAIARGGAVYARSYRLRQKIVTCRRSRDSIGMVGYRTFKEEVHGDDADVVVLASGRKVVRDMMNWAFTRGRLSRPVVMNLKVLTCRAAEKIYSKTEKILECTVELKESEIAKAGAVPQDLYSSGSDSAPQALDSSCKKVGTMYLNLIRAAHARRTELTKQNGGRAPRVIDIPVRLVFCPGNDKGVMVVKAMANKQTSCGEPVEIDYVADPMAGVKPRKAMKAPKRAKSEED